NPPDPANNAQMDVSNNSWEANMRVGTKYGAAANDTSSWGGGGPAPTYPDVWLRLKRVGNAFTGYRATDGTTWTQIAQNTWANAPATLLVGPGYGPENANSFSDPTVFPAYMTQYRNFGDIVTGPAQPKITGIALQGGNITVTWAANTGTLETAPAVTGPWTSTGNSSGTYSAAVSGAQWYGRLKQ